METYEYRGRNRRGELMRGTMESPSAQAVATWLMSTDIFPVSIRSTAAVAQHTPQWLARLRGRTQVSHVQMLVFTRQMSNMVRAGMQMMDAIEGIRKTTESVALRRILQAVRDDLDRGMVLSAALARHPRVFDDYYVNMIRVGEGTGKLEEAFRNLYEQLEFDRAMRKKMKAAMRYPVFVLCALALAMGVVTVFVIPAFAKTYATLKVDLPLLTRALLATSGLAVNYWWALALIVGLGGIAADLALKQPDVRYAWDRFKLRLPIVGPVITKATIARFARSFATAMKSDVPIVLAFQLVSRVVDNAFYESRILQMRLAVERGEVLSRAMKTSGIFSPLELQLISVAERTGEVDQAVDEIARLYSEEVDYQASRLSQTIEPLLLAMMGVLVGLLVLGVFLPMWDLAEAHFRH